MSNILPHSKLSFSKANLIIRVIFSTSRVSNHTTRQCHPVAQQQQRQEQHENKNNAKTMPSFVGRQANYKSNRF